MITMMMAVLMTMMIMMTMMPLSVYNNDSDDDSVDNVHDRIKDDDCNNHVNQYLTNIKTAVTIIWQQWGECVEGGSFGYINYLV